MGDDETVKYKTSSSALTRKHVLIVLIVSIVFVIAAGIIGYYIGKGQSNASQSTISPTPVTATATPNAQNYYYNVTVMDNLHRNMAEAMNATRIQETLRYLTKKVHHSGSAENVLLAEYIKNRWVANGFDDVKTVKYNVLLSYPDPANPNVVGIKDDQGTFQYRASLKEEILHPDENDPNVLPPFNAYANAGQVEGDLIYVNYGRYEDFLILQKQFNSSCVGKIAIVRYGKIYRGDKPKYGQMFGCIGMIIYSDPADTAPEGYDKSYPNGWYLPYSGVQRGAIVLDGDPETPGHPSVDGAYRVQNLNKIIPTIPVQPMSAKDAKYLLETLSGPAVPANWQGKLPITYNIGGSFLSNMSNWQVHLAVNNKRMRKDIYNVIGTIKGKIEPDRYLLIGNHRDSWVFGAIDPSSATSVMLEVAQIMGDRLKKGWRPRRTLKFCSWDAEEFSIIGSTEWVEENSKELIQRSVAYLNIDLALIGNYTFSAQSSPAIIQAVYAAAKNVKDPTDPTQSVYDIWKKRLPFPLNGKPAFVLLGSGSDHKPFIQEIGVSAISFAYIFNTLNSPLSNYPTYHTLYDTFDYVKRTVDPTFTIHLSVAKILLLLGLQFADYPIIPIKTTDYAEYMNIYFLQVQASTKVLLQSHNISLDYVASAIKNFTIACSKFDNNLKTIDIKDILKLRSVNDQLMYLERAFILPEGLPNRPYSRHIFMAPSQFDQYTAAPFPGIVDAIAIGQRQNNWEVAKQQVAIAAYMIQSAANTLRID